jgi:hypothetical protein
MEEFQCQMIGNHQTLHHQQEFRNCRHLGETRRDFPDRLHHTALPAFVELVEALVVKPYKLLSDPLNKVATHLRLVAVRMDYYERNSIDQGFEDDNLRECSLFGAYYFENHRTLMTAAHTVAENFLEYLPLVQGVVVVVESWLVPVAVQH